jgi:putative membrane protein
VTIAALVLSGWLYSRGAWRVWHAAGVGHGVARWQVVTFATGWLTLLLTLLSPLHTLGSVLFSAHMVQHEVLMIIAAPLVVLSRPLLALLWGLPKRLQHVVSRCRRAAVVQTSWRVLTDPFAAWGIHAIAVWIWHLPVLYQATLTNELVHTTQHVSFLGTALLFWWALLHGRHGQRGYGMAVLYVFTTAIHTSVLGALLTFAPSPWYPAYTETIAVGNLTALEDQQLGGVIMWVPAGTIYVLAGLGFFAAWLRASERRVLAHEAARTASEAL